MMKQPISISDSIIFETLDSVAKNMFVAAKTAPKARGINNLEVIIVYEKTIKHLSEKMKVMGERDDQAFFIRDADCILQSPVLLLFGTRINPLGLKKCGMCGFENCDEKNKRPYTPCVFNTGDLGIAIGSAVSIAMDNRVDNRIMFSVGQAALELKLMDADVKIIYGVPLSASTKNPFFDR